MNAELKDLRGKIEQLRQNVHEIIKQAGPDLDMSKVTVISGDNATKVHYMQALNAELDECMKKAEPLEVEYKAINRAREQLKKFGEPVSTYPFPVAGEDGDGNGKMWAPQPGRSIGKAIVDAWQEQGGLAKGKAYEIDYGEDGITKILAEHEMKTTMATSAGWAPQAIRTGRMVEYAARPIQVLDLIPGNNTSQNAVVYMEETTFTPAATEIAEAGTYPEAALAYTERSSSVRKIAVFIPVTDEQLEDIPQIQGLLNNRLPFFLRQRLDSQIVNGNNVPPNLMGLANLIGKQTQAKGDDPVPDAVYKAMTKIRVSGRAVPSGIVMHSTDWEGVRLLRTADGIYIFGSPSDPGVDRLWGLPVSQADSFAAGTAYVGDFAGFSEVVQKRGIEVKVSDSHSDYFIHGVQAVRADFRVAVVWYRPPAFAEVTGL